MDVGFRERKKEHTRQRLIDAAFRLFDEHGYDATTVEMIADAAMVSARTFFRYFPTKDALLAEPGSLLLRLLIERLRTEGIRRPDPRGLLRLLAEHLRDEVTVGRASIAVRQVRRPQLHDRAAVWRQRWATELAEGLADLDGRGSPTFDERIAATAAVALVGCAIDEWILRDTDADLLDLVQHVITTLWG
ncbi:MAG: TetR/AcrR family transcriptional regulator [Actinobacteria bacterium]|nr:TetR/AcrR family transcriptional regulator [Actinomycetota bacterium]